MSAYTSLIVLSWLLSLGASILVGLYKGRLRNAVLLTLLFGIFGLLFVLVMPGKRKG
jgi:hypothetical protein